MRRRPSPYGKPFGLLLAAILAIGAVVEAWSVEAFAQESRGGSYDVAFLDRLFGGGGGREIAPPPEEVGPPVEQPRRWRRRRAEPPPDERYYDERAYEERPRRGLGAIFGRRRPREAAPPDAGPEQRPKQARKKRPAAPAEPAFETAEIKPKAPDARKVLVVGDFAAGGLAWGLDQAFADEPLIAIIDKSNGSSGFVRSDHYDWNVELPSILDAEKPDMIVVMIGANDRQTIRTPQDRFAMGTPEWQKAYEQRLESFLLALQSYGRPFYWLGAPPLKQDAASADMTFLSSLYEARVKAVGGTFIDVWDGFADENGKFVTRGPDMDGQVKQLRTSDGIGFTRAGRRKLAFYVETEIRRDGGVLTPGSSLISAVNPNEVIEIGPDGKERKLGPVVSLTDPPPGAAEAPLAGAEPPAPPSAESAQYRLVVEGAPPAPEPGRVDDFTWRPEPEDDGEDESAGLGRVDGVVILPAPTAGVATGAAVE